MYNPLVSIIIPLYNAEKYITETINSALNQTWKNKEIIIIDDGSTDESYIIAKRFESENVIITRQKNTGASAARNKGLKIAKGEYVQFLDADDVLSENKIEDQVIGLINNPSYIAICDTVYFKDGEDPLSFGPNVAWYSQTFDNNVKFLMNLYGGESVGPNLGGMIQPNCWLTPKKILDMAGEWNEALSVDDDGEYFCRVLLVAKGIYYNAKSLNYYRQNINGENLSAQHTFKGLVSMMKSTEFKQNHLLKILPNNILKQSFSLFYQEICILSYPKHKAISKLALQKAKSLGLKKIEYNGGPFSTLLSKVFGWKTVKILNHLRYALKKL